MLAKTKASGKIIIIITILVSLIILALDLLLPLGVAAGVPYVFLVLIALRSPWVNYVYLMAVLGTILTVVGYLASPDGGIQWMVLTNRALALFVIWTTAILGILIQRSEERLRTIIDTAADGIISIDEQGLIISFNKSAETILGYTAEEILGRNVSTLVPPKYRKQHSDYIRRYLEMGEVEIIGVGRRVIAQHKNDSLIPVYLTISEVKIGVRSTFIGTIRNLTKEEEREAQLQKFWRAVDQCPISIVITDIEGNIEYVNPYFSYITGYELKEVLGKHTRILKSSETPSHAYTDLWETISRGDVWRGVLRNRKKNSELFWESATICPVTDQDNKITHYIALKEDITDKREKDLMLTRAMKLEAVGRMTDGIAHDFNNLLTIILGNLQLLQEDIESGAESDKYLLEDAMSAAHDGSELIKRLLSFSRTQKPNTESTDINRVLKELQRLLVRTVPEDIAMTFELSENINDVIIDTNRLESAILNLVTNARDAMPEGGKLTISTCNLSITEPEFSSGGQIIPGSYVMISVNDNGIGMNDEVRQHLLEPFYTSKASGTGLGLSMVYDFIKEFDGGLRVDSEPGKGTTISLFLPVQEMEIESPKTEDWGSEALPTGNETILLVEDREKLRRFASRILNKLGYHVLEAEDAARALECLEANEGIDLLFSDIIMPGEMNGRQLARQAIIKWPSLSVLLSTGMEPAEEHNNDSSVEFAMLAKPYTTIQLAKSVRNILDS